MQGKRVFGGAEDFYRIRVLRVDIPDELEWEWREDVLWRRVPAADQGSTPRFRIDAVINDTGESLTIAEVDTAQAAAELAQTADEDLSLMTKRQFDVRYGLPESA